MRFYKLTVEECAKIEAFNETQKDTLLIICDHGEGRIGIEADAVESLPFQKFFTELGNQLKQEQIVEITKEELDEMDSKTAKIS